MNKNRVMWMTDAMLALALFLIIYNLRYPYVRNLRGFWEMRKDLSRTAVSILWLISLWINRYEAWDRAECVTPWIVFGSAALMGCILATPYVTTMVIEYYIAPLSYRLYVGLMLLMACVDCLMALALEKTHADLPNCASAASRLRKRLAVAMGMLALGEVVCIAAYKQAAWLSVGFASVWLMGSWIWDAKACRSEKS